MEFEQATIEKGAGREEMMAEARRELLGLKRRNDEYQEKNDRRYDPHLSANIQTGFLSESEVDVWNKVKNVSSMEEWEKLQSEFARYRDSELAKARKPEKELSDEERHHTYFLYYLGHQLTEKMADFIP